MLKQRRDLPSLDLLKGFEAAARNLSFTKAAAELFVTQSAVSRQVKTLEEQLGVALFRRLHPGIDMRLAATNEIQDIEREGIDLAIRYCTPKAAGASAVRLFGELVFPVCSKSVLAGRN